MLELIVLVIFLVSLLGIVAVLFFKIPALVCLPENGKSDIRKNRIVVDAEKKLRSTLASFKKQTSLHKILSVAKIVILKIEVKIDKLLYTIRVKAQQKNNKK